MAWFGYVPDYVEPGTEGPPAQDDEWLRRRLEELNRNPVGTDREQQSVSSTPPQRTWGDTVRDIIPNIKRGAQAVGGLLTADVATPIDRAMRFPGLDIPPDAKEEQWDSGTMFRLADGRLVYPSDLPHRAAALPVQTEQQWPFRTSLAVPGLLDIFPAAGSGVGPPAAEGGVVLGANMARRARGGPRVIPPEVPEYVPPAAGTVETPYAARSAPWRPIQAPGVPELDHLPPGHLYDPAKAAEAGRGATQGMTDAEYADWIAGRRSVMSPGVAVLNQVGKGERGSASLPSLRTMTPEDAATAARADPHLAFRRPDGNYVGAPAGVNSPEALAANRANFDAQVARGVGGSDWYERVNNYINEISGRDPIKARQIAEEWAVFSAQADPGTNSAFALQARNAQMRGVPADIVRTGQQARTYNEARALQDEFLQKQAGPRNAEIGNPEQDIYAESDLLFPAMRLGKKTDIYRQHMDPTAVEGSTGTNDIWHGRAFGYVDPKTGKEWDKAFGPAQHNWLDYETMQALNRANDAQLGGRTNWKPGEIQAAPWVSGKSESLQKRYNISPEEGDRRANATYPDFAHWYTGNMPHEQIPGGNTGLTTGIMTPQEFHEAGRRINPGGMDPQLEHMGFVSRATTPGTGAWVESPGSRLETNPVDVSRPQLDTWTNPATGKREFHPGTASALESAAAVRGVSDMQIGNPVTMLDPRAQSGAATSVDINIGRGLTQPEAARLHALGQEYGLDLTNTGTGAGFLNFKEGAKGQDVQKQLKAGLEAKIREILPDAKISRVGTPSTNKYVYYGDNLSLENAGRGLATRQMDEILQRNRFAAPGAYERLLDDPNEAVKAAQNLQRLQASGQVGVRPDYELWQRLIAEGRLRRALEWARANGYQGLPVAVGGAGLGAGLLGGADSTGPGS